MEPVSYAEEDGTSGLVIEVFDDLNKVCADVVLLYGCPHKSPMKRKYFAANWLKVLFRDVPMDSSFKFLEEVNVFHKL